MLTHCNTGSLATAGLGTALGVIPAFAWATVPGLRRRNPALAAGRKADVWELLQDQIPRLSDWRQR